MYMHLSFLWYKLLGKAKFTNESQVAYQAGAYPGFWASKQPKVLLLPLDGMIVHHRVTPGIKFAGTHLYICVERGTARVKCLVQEHNTMFPARAAWTVWSGDKHTNHEATALPMYPMIKSEEHYNLTISHLLLKCLPEQM